MNSFEQQENFAIVVVLFVVGNNAFNTKFIIAFCQLRLAWPVSGASTQ